MTDPKSASTAMASVSSRNPPFFLADIVSSARQARTIALLAVLLLVAAVGQVVSLHALSQRRHVTCFLPEIAAPTVAARSAP